MSAAPSGAIVRITYDSRARVMPGDMLLSATGRGYLVVQAWRPSRGANTKTRWNLRAEVLPAGVRPDSPPSTVFRPRIHRLRWFPRKQRGR